MMLPSNIPIYSYAPIVDFDDLEPILVHPPRGGLRGWAKLQELERRLDFFDWALFVVREPNRLTRFLNDCTSAFIMTFEAAIQLLKHESGSRPRFDTWFGAHTSGNYIIRGLRTHRHLEAHIRASGISPNPSKEAHSRFAGGIDAGDTTSWHFAPISLADFRQLQRPYLDETELPLWASLVTDLSAKAVMFEGLRGLVELYKEAEAGRTAGTWP